MLIIIIYDFHDISLSKVLFHKKIRNVLAKFKLCSVVSSMVFNVFLNIETTEYKNKTLKHYKVVFPLFTNNRITNLSGKKFLKNLIKNRTKQFL